jgi:hypothetical protein
MDFKTLAEVKIWLDHTLGPSEEGDFEQLGHALSPFRNGAQVCNLLKVVLNDPEALKMIAAKSYGHVNAFDKIVLLSSSTPPYKLRLHIWWPIPEELARAKEGFRTHDHRWNFSSVILCGAFRVEQFEVTAEDHGLEMHRYHYIAADDKDYYTMDYLGQAKIECTLDAVMRRGDYYTLSHKVQHRITSNRQSITATLFLRGPVVKPLVEVFADKPIEGHKKVEIKPLETVDLSKKLEDLLSFLAGG